MKLTALPRRVAALNSRLLLPPRTFQSIYSSAEWKKLVAKIIAERGRRCERCGRTDCRIFADHIHELRDGGEPFDPANIQLLCSTCHPAKTAEARAARRARS